MAIKVRYKATDRVYLLLGVGYGAFTHSHTGLLGVPNEEEEHMEMVAVCDAKGSVLWARTADVEVVEVDGHRPQEVLPTYAEPEVLLDANTADVSDQEYVPAPEED